MCYILPQSVVFPMDYSTIDLFLRPCLCYQLQSIEQNMYELL